MLRRADVVRVLRFEVLPVYESVRLGKLRVIANARVKGIALCGIASLLTREDQERLKSAAVARYSLCRALGGLCLRGNRLVRGHFALGSRLGRNLLLLEFAILDDVLPDLRPAVREDAPGVTAQLEVRRAPAAPLLDV